MTLHFDPADRAYFKAVATWALSSARLDALDVDPSVASGLVRRLALLPPEAARLVADRAVDPRAQAEPLSDALEPILSTADDETRQRFAAILTGDPTQRAQLLTQFFAPPTLTAITPADLPAARTDGHSNAEHAGCTHCDDRGCTGCVRTDWQPGDEAADDLEPGEQLLRARRAGRRAADRALLDVFGTSGTVDPDDDDTSGTSDEDDDIDPDATQTRAARRTRTDGDSPMNTRDDIHNIVHPKSPADQRAARERFNRTTDDAIRESHRTDAADREMERLLDNDDPIPFVESDLERAARDAARRRAHAVGRTDAKEGGTSPASFHATQRLRFHQPPDGNGGGNEAA